jgi:Rrf2 family protein
MQFTNAAGYGISACSYLASVPTDQYASNTAICKAFKMPDRFVSQVMLQLAKVDIVESVQGRFGGYRLSKPANKTTLLEVVEAIDGPIGANGDVDLAGLSRDSQTAVGKALAAIEADARKRLAAITLADLRAAKAA